MKLKKDVSTISLFVMGAVRSLTDQMNEFGALVICGVQYHVFH